MRILANLALGRLDLPPAGILEVAGCLDRATLRLIEGQYLDISFETQSSITADQYLEMVAGKTAALIAAALEIGAIVGCGDRESSRRLHELGHALGLAFQIRDDILGIWGESGLTGKPVGGDIARRKKTYPVVYAWQQAESRQREQLRQLYKAASLGQENISAVASCLEEIGARKGAQMLVERYSLEALERLQSFGFPARIDAGFQELITGLISRSG
jgi:geranylgeranyl diphosphate synthase type I